MLEAKNIHKIYHNGVKELRVLNGIGLSVQQAEFAAITGPSGAGKSTLLHILGGLDMPTEGSVSFSGSDFQKIGEDRLSGLRNAKIGFVFQFYHLLSEFTALENVMMPALIRGQGPGPRGQAKETAPGLLEKVGLKDRMGHFPSQLSGGEKQRVALARALINAPEILFCDEPTGNLDSKAGSEVMDLISRLNRENKMAVVLVTHNPELAKLAHKAYYLRDGILREAA